MNEELDIHPKMYIYKRIVEAKLYIDNHYSEKIDLDKISNQASFSKFHFLRIFKAAFGKSPHKYLTEVRLQNALKLLNENKSISEVCYEIGFESVPSFTLLFKNYLGVSPKEYIKQLAYQNKQKENNPLSFIPNCFIESHGWEK